MSIRWFLTVLVATGLGLAACATYTFNPPCTSTADCKDGWVCVEGTCRSPGCSRPEDCTSSQKCIDSRCTDCVCATDADCLAIEFCSESCICRPRQVTPCLSDSDCSGGELCIELTCQAPPTCVTDADCPGGLVCERGACARPCEAASDCGTLYQCVAGHCLQQCLSDRACLEPDTICEGNLCVPAECTQDSDCVGEYLRCRSGRCESYTPCGSDADCGDPNFVCRENICEELPTCFINSNCQAGEICLDGHCHPAPSCQSDAECAPDRDCIGGLCLPHVCRGPQDCEAGLVCVAGECIKGGDPAIVYSVIILTPGGPIRSGQQLQLKAIALNQSGDEVPGIVFDWSSSEPTRASVDTNGVLTGGDQAGDTLVTATAVGSGRKSRPTQFTNVLNVEAGRLRVTVVEAIGRAPVVGATVVLESGGMAESALTDSQGAATFTAPGGAANAHVFSDTHDYVSVVNTSSIDLLIPLPPRSSGSKAGGFTGQLMFSGVGTVSIGLAGASIAGNLLDLNFGKLLGQTFRVTMNLGTRAITLPLPAQMVMGLSYNNIPITIKDSYYVLGEPGLRTAWALGGRLDISVLGDIIGGAGSISDFLTRVFPYFSLLDHGVRPTYDLFPLPLVIDGDDRDGDGDTTEMRPDWDGFPDLDLAPSQPQSLSVEIVPPNLPVYAGTPMNSALLISGGLSPLGFTPLGLTAQEASGGELPPLVMKMAPVYGGLEAGSYAVLVLGFTGGSGMIMPSDMAAVVHTSEDLPIQVAFDTGFLTFPEDAQYYAAGRTLVASGIAGASLFLSTLKSGPGQWNVYLPVSDLSTFTLPTPPEGMADLASGATVILNPISLKSGMTFEDLVTFNGDDLDRLNWLVSAFSRFELP